MTLKSALFINLIISAIFVSARLRLMPFQFHGSCVKPSTCVSIWKCPHYVSSLRNLHADFLLKSLAQGVCDISDLTNPHVCCNFTQNTTALKVVTEESLEDDELLKHKNFGFLPVDICGTTPANFESSGSNTSPGKFPWMALIVYETGTTIRCSGTLINDRYVLTAAHCVNGTDLLGVRLGEYNLMTDQDCNTIKKFCAPPVQDVLISEVIIHPEFDQSSLANDIALIRLATPANFSQDNLRPVCLPFGNLMNVDLVGMKLIICGWGVTKTGERSAVLRNTSLRVISNKQCNEFYKNIKPVATDQLCTLSDNGKAECVGDEGAPLKFIDFLDGKPRYFQYGIISYGPKQCGVNNIPGVSTDVRKYMVWILDNMKPSSIY